MKKTVSVNIKGLNFMIEEDAYELLHQYIKRLEAQLHGQKGSKDIVEDIELRVAELCQGYLSDKKQVVEKEDIEAIIATLGQPEDFLEEEEGTKEQSYTTYTAQPESEKRLYRDIENAKIAGICAGLANYFHMDVIVVRIIFLVFLFFGGFGFPLYVILWLVIPKTISSIDRLKMQGKPITVDNVRDEVEQAAQRFGASSRSFADRIRKDSSVSKRVSRIGRFITQMVGIGLIGFGSFLLVIFLVFILGGMRMIPVETDHGYLSITEFSSLVLSTEGDAFWIWLGGGIVAFSVILFLVSNGTYILLRIRNKWTKIASLTLFLTGIVGSAICVNMGIKTSGEWISEAEMERKVAFVNHQELILDVLQGSDKSIGEFKLKEGRRFGFLRIKNNRIYGSGIEILYRASNDSAYHVYQNFSSDGRYYQQALQRAKNMKHEIHCVDNKVEIAPSFSYPLADKLRDQSVQIIVEIPRNKWVRIGNERISVDSFDEGEMEKYSYIDFNGEIEHWD